MQRQNFNFLERDIEPIDTLLIMISIVINLFSCWPFNVRARFIWLFLFLAFNNKFINRNVSKYLYRVLIKV